MYFCRVNLRKLLTKKSLEDLEFQTVLQQLSTHCVTELGVERIRSLHPMVDFEAISTALSQTAEYKSSFENDNRIPNHGFDAIKQELSLLRIENSQLELEDFRRCKSLVETTQIITKFFKKFKEYYPTLYRIFEEVDVVTEISKEINGVIDRFGAIKDRASEDLYQIRKQMGSVRSKIGQSFGSALNTYHGAGFLDEIKESIIDNRRVLTVKAMYRRKVKGAIMGSSKTGSIVYIEPEATLQYSRELQNLQYEETEEITRILKELTNFLRPYRSFLETYQEVLTVLDTISAKALYAKRTHSTLPILNTHQQLYLRDAYHPLLFLANELKGEKTFPQTIELKKDNRIIIISGPNAGGKSITLKTIGLLQLMLQGGLLVPVHERSNMCVFQKILTDIGDNQSIENHLSTYSYRLKNMNRFLKKCDASTLFLIDEFGTGSDPELGGALAEIFLEVFYERESFGVITTHYANLKLLATELPYMTNANMEFDNKSLQPTFNLVLGEAGSSFTFEVAQKNGIPFRLINQAKKKIEKGKVRFDASIAKMQKERSQLSKTSKSLKAEEIKAQVESERLEVLNDKMKKKLISYQELFDNNQRMIVLGNKINDAAEQYFLDGKKRPLVAELLRLVETENSKRKRLTAKKHKEAKEVKKKVEKEVLKKVVKVRKEKKINKVLAQKKEVSKPRPVLKVGDRVRMFDGKSVGSIDVIEKNKAIVNYGIFTTQINLEALELVEAVKK